MVISGEATVYYGVQVKNFAIGEVRPLQNESDKPLTIIELQMGTILKEEDIYRFADMYGRS